LSPLDASALTEALVFIITLPFSIKGSNLPQLPFLCNLFSPHSLFLSFAAKIAILLAQFTGKGFKNEADLSTKQKTEDNGDRFSCPDEHQKWAQNPLSPAP
jgi:hypothetical protein